MPIMKLSKQPFSQAEITEDLLALRAHCLNQSSGFAVTAVGEYKVGDAYVLIAGVNIEDKRLNRLSLHAEHSVLVNAQTLLGEKAKLHKLTVMGAASAVKQGAKDGSADNDCMMCGNCRQLVLSSSIPNAEMYTITLNGKMSGPFLIKDQLPNAFSERDLQLPAAATKTNGEKEVKSEKSTSKFFSQVSYEISDFIHISSTLGKDVIFTYLNLLTPHIIDPKFKTSNVDACIIKLKQDDKISYAPGTVVQDVAFLTSEALYSALSYAITEKGHKDLEFEEVYLFSDKLNSVPLFGAELDLLARFAKGENIPIHAFSKEGQHQGYTLDDCFDRHKAGVMNLEPGMEEEQRRDLFL